MLNYKVVKCPPAYKKIIENAFDAKGITNIGSEDERDSDNDSLEEDENNENESTNSEEKSNYDENESEKDKSSKKSSWYCNWNKCDGEVEGGHWCNQKRWQCKNCGGKVCLYSELKK